MMPPIFIINIYLLIFLSIIFGGIVMNVKLKLGAKGFGLLEVLISFGLLGMLSLGVGTLFKNIAVSKRRSDNFQSEIQSKKEIRMILSKDDWARLSIAGNGAYGFPTDPVTFYKVNHDGDNPGEGLPIEVWIGNSDGTLRTTRKFPNMSSTDKVKIQSMVMTFPNELGSNYPESPSYVDIAQVQVDMVRQLDQEEQVRSYTFPILVETSTDADGLSTILSASIHGADNMGGTISDFDEIAKEVCDRTKGFTWNDTNKECEKITTITQRIVFVALRYNGSAWIVNKVEVQSSNNESDIDGSETGTIIDFNPSRSYYHVMKIRYGSSTICKSKEVISAKFMGNEINLSQPFLENRSAKVSVLYHTGISSRHRLFLSKSNSSGNAAWENGDRVNLLCVSDL